MTEKMLYILGVPTEGDKIKSDDQNTQLETEVATYVGAIEGKSVDSNITVKDPTETWFAELGQIYNNGIIKQNDNLIDFYNEEQLKENTFLLRMGYTDNLAKNIEIIFFDSDGKKIDPVVIEVNENTIVIPKELTINPKTIKVLIEDLTGIKIKDSEKNDIQLKNATDKTGNPFPLNDSPVGLKNSGPIVNLNSGRKQLNPYPILGKGGSSHKTRKGKRNNTKNNKKGGSKTKRKSSRKRVNKK
jgi:hypothetical protein